jgi:hypothetical protein
MRMTDHDLLSHIAALEKHSHGGEGDEIASQQKQALDYYMGRPYGTEEEGRSQARASVVWDVVEGMCPLVIKPFIATDDAVRFNPTGPEDEETAQQESEYINWVVTQRNDSFNELLAWVKMGLLQKNGVVKYWWDVSKAATIERYYGVSADVLALLSQEPGVEVIEHSQTDQADEMGQPLHDVTLRTTEEIGRARYTVIPNEELRISVDTRSPDLKKARFVQHRRRVTIGDLRNMGYDVEVDLADSGDAGEGLNASGLEADRLRDAGQDPLSRLVLYKETYLVVDADGDGDQELRKVCHVGSTMLCNEETEEIPFTAWTPYLQPNQYYGRCPADEAVEIETVKSTLLRQTLDNVYSINNNRVYVGSRVNLDDLLDNAIAGVVRVEGDGPVGNAVMPAAVTPIGNVTLPLMELMDSLQENRTGFTKYNQGSDSDSLNKTATGIRMIKEAANQRIDIVQRAFANGMADLMRGVHGLCRRHATKAETIRLRNKWVPIDPRAWKMRQDMTVSVGLGASDQQMRMAGVQMLMAEQKQLFPLGIVQKQHLINSAGKLAEVVGYKNPEEFFGEPEQKEMDPAVKQALEASQQEIQALHQELQKAQSGIQKAQIDAQTKMALEQMKQQTEAMRQDYAQALQAMRDEAAYDRQELAGVVTLLSKQIAPPQVLAADVDGDIAEEDADGQG